MADEEKLRILKEEGVTTWNQWRQQALYDGVLLNHG
jgi:hypothetical protein